MKWCLGLNTHYSARAYWDREKEGEEYDKEVWKGGEERKDIDIVVLWWLIGFSGLEKSQAES